MMSTVVMTLTSMSNYEVDIITANPLINQLINKQSDRYWRFIGNCPTPLHNI